MARILSVSPVLRTKDIISAIERYIALGFQANPFDGGRYADLCWGDIQLHLTQDDKLDPPHNEVQVYLYVDSADELHAQWEKAGVAGKLQRPLETDYGMNEGAYLDPDGNLIAFGSKV